MTMTTNVAQQEGAATGLLKLAADFEGAAYGEWSHTRWIKLRHAAAQLRRCAGLVESGRYDLDTAESWLIAGQVTLRKYVTARAVAEL